MFTADAYSAMESGRNEKAIDLFERHVRVLLDKKIQYQNDKEKLDAIDGDLQLIGSLITNLKQKMLGSSSKKFVLISEDKIAMENEMSCYPKVAQDTLRRMLTQKLRHYTFDDVVGLQWAKVGR